MKVEYKNRNWQQEKVKGFSGKELLNTINGGIKLVNILPESSYPMHVHPDKTEFMYLLEGYLNCIIEKNQFAYKEGDFIIFPEGLKQGIKNLSENNALAIIGNIKN